MARTLRIGINGFGRIGRAILRQWMQNVQGADFEIVAINDIAPAETCAYLLEFDSVYGAAPFAVEQFAGGLRLNDRQVRLTQSPDLSILDWSDVDIVFECTGKAKDRAFAEAGLRAGADKVLISGPSPVADLTVVTGANDSDLADQIVVSNASCTTNALAPLMAVLDESFGLITGHMTTIHCYTGSQPTIDAPRGDALERNRAAALSMVPTTTSAAKLIDDVLPHLRGRVQGCAVRVPTASVSAVDLTCLLERTPDIAQLHSILTTARPGIIGVTERRLVSSDLKARPESLILALPETTITEGGLVRVFGWYDNEWGFSARMFDVAEQIGRRLR